MAEKPKVEAKEAAPVSAPVSQVATTPATPKASKDASIIPIPPRRSGGVEGAIDYSDTKVGESYLFPDGAKGMSALYATARRNGWKLEQRDLGAAIGKRVWRKS